MRQLSSMLMLTSLIALSGCNNDMEKQLQDAKSQIAVLEEKLKGKDDLIKGQNETMQHIQDNMTETLKICKSATGDENLKKQIVAISEQYKTLFKQFNFQQLNEQIASSMDKALKICSEATGDENLKKQVETLFGQYTTLMNQCKETKCNPPVQTPDQTTGPSPQPYTLGDRPPPNSDIKQDDMDKMFLLGAAYIACNYYSAGICGAVLAFVAQKLGITQDEVKTSYEKAYRQLPGGGRGIEVTLPDGRRITLKDPTARSDNRQSHKVEGNNPPPGSISDTDVCTIMNRYRSDPTMAHFIQELGNPLLFPTKNRQANAISAAKNSGYTDLANILESIRISGEGNGVPCD